MPIKLFSIIGKNFRVLLRSRTSALMVLIGPLFIIVLVGLAFNNQSSLELNVGVSSPSGTYTPLAEEFISALQENNFRVTRISGQDACLEQIKFGTVHACIVFPADFEVANDKTNELVFYVDQTRTNFVYAIQEAVSSKVAVQSSKLSYDLTIGLLTVISDAKAAEEETLVRMLKAKSSLEASGKDLDLIKSKLGSIDLSSGNISMDALSDKIFDVETDIMEWNDDTESFIDDTREFLDDMENLGGTAENLTLEYKGDTFEGFNETSSDNFNASAKDVAALKTQLNTTSRNIKALQSKVQFAVATNAEISDKASALKSRVVELQADVAATKAQMEKLKDGIDALSVTNAENIVNPITTRIEPVVSRGTNLMYFFPYLVMLIVMLISLLLSSTLVVMEKSSRAYFRNFITPTKDLTMILATYITNLIIVVLEVGVMLAIAYYFLTTSIFTNIWLVLLLLFLAISLFTVIGMAIGYLIRSQEGTMLASIAVGSIFLLLSNLVIPLESMARFIQELAKYNPYVVGSEVFRKLILFKLSLSDLALQFVLLAAVSGVIFIAMVMTQKLAKIRYFTKMPHVAKEKGTIHKEVPVFKLVSNVLLTGIDDLARELEDMDDDTFKAHVSKSHNDFYVWIKDGIENKELAEKIRLLTSQEEMAKVLVKELKK